MDGWRSRHRRRDDAGRKHVEDRASSRRFSREAHIARDDPNAPPLADVVVQLGNRLGLDVVAEGVTEERQHKVLEEAGCRYAQGDLFGRPMPAERVEALFGVEPVTPRPPAPEDNAQNMGQVDSGHEMRQS